MKNILNVRTCYTLCINQWTTSGAQNYPPEQGSNEESEGLHRGGKEGKEGKSKKVLPPGCRTLQKCTKTFEYRLH